MTPKQLYLEYLSNNLFRKDENQYLAIEKFERIFRELTKKRIHLPAIFNVIKFRHHAVKGLYLWGGVGIGKTMLMDIFYQCLAPEMKMRIHFHQFMRNIHLELKRLQGHKNPLKLIAKRLAAKVKVICFDEFIVVDIVDAMLLANLLQALFEYEVCLVATSNFPPDDLYKNGLQRERFLPAIALIKEQTEVFHLTTSKDYRLRILAQAGIYYFPINEYSRKQMRARFEELAGTHSLENELLTIEGRAIPTIRFSHEVAWFNFKDLCQIPRSQIDYLELARCFHTILLSNIPKIGPKQNDLILYLINLVDILYDTNTKLIISAEVSIEQIYIQGLFLKEFQRTKSRLLEMQSMEYMQKPHQAK